MSRAIAHTAENQLMSSIDLNLYTNGKHKDYTFDFDRNWSSRRTDLLAVLSNFGSHRDQ